MAGKAVKSGNKLAVVTGASSGIGYELAVQFAQKGYDLIIAAEDKGIEVAAAELAEHGVFVRPVRVDLVEYDGVEELYKIIKEQGRPVDAIALNAGVGVSGHFIENNLGAELDMINLNVSSLVHLAKLVLKDMVSQGYGRVLITSSIAAILASPFEAVYSGTKAFLLAFSQGLREELKDTGVTVTALMPGATETNFFKRAGAMDTKLGQSEKDNPADVAKDGFEALMNGDDKVVAHSAKTKIQSSLGRILPDSMIASMHRAQSEPGSAEKH